VVGGAWWGRALVRERRVGEGLVRCGILRGSSGGRGVIGAGVEGSGRGRWRNSWRGDGDLMTQPLELELLDGVKEGGGKMGEHMASEVMRELLVVRDRRKVMQDSGARRRPLAAFVAQG
jgi:hypothetical protein